MSDINIRRGDGGQVFICDGANLIGVGMTFESAQADAQEALQVAFLDVCLLRKPEWAERQEQQVAAILEQLS